MIPIGSRHGGSPWLTVPLRLTKGKRPTQHNQGGMAMWSPGLFSDSPLCRRQPLTTETLGRSLRVLRLGEAEHHEVPVSAAQRLRERRRRYDTGRQPLPRCTLYARRDPYTPSGSQRPRQNRPPVPVEARSALACNGAKGARSVRAQPSAKSLATGNVFGGMFNPAHHRRVLLMIVDLVIALT
jgi:hypothetical protein